MTGVEPPATDVLVAGLANLLGQPASVVERAPNPYSSSVSTELVTVALGTEHRTFFCKHGGHEVDLTKGHRRGVPYEALAYEVLLPGAPAPASPGSFASDDGTTLVTEAILDAVRLTKASGGSDSAYVRAAALLGRWHATTRAPSADVNRFDRSHFVAWAAQLRDGRNPLGRLVGADVIDAAADVLADAAPTVVHGELFPANVLLRDGAVYFVDWETAGIGAGELDLAAMTTGGWGEGTPELCARSYAESRWPAGAPEEFEATLAAARLYALAFVAHHSGRRGRLESWLETETRKAAASVKAAA